MSKKEPKVFIYSLGVIERLLFLNVYPKKGDYSSQLLFEALNAKLLTEEERRDIYQIKQIADCECGEEISFFEGEKIPDCPNKCLVKPKLNGRISWRTTDDEGRQIPDEKEVTIGEMAHHNITQALRELEEAEELNPSLVSLYRKIVLNGTKLESGVDDITLMGIPKGKREK